VKCMYSFGRTDTVREMRQLCCYKDRKWRGVGWLKSESNGR
jgi:hypothetical protein